MMKRYYYPILLSIITIISGFHAGAQQVLTLKDAIQTALTNYGTIKAKSNYVNAARASVKETYAEALPDLNLSAQQDYGTINGQNGPLYGYRGLSVASSGPVLPNQNWNAAFGALYLANINWDFYSFGKIREKQKVYESILHNNEDDLEQEKFQQQVRASAAYLNLLAAQRIVKAQQANLDRAVALSKVVIARVKSGLNPGVDSSLANAQVSNARIVLTNAQDYAQEQANQLSQLLGTAPATEYVIDTQFVVHIPTALYDTSKQALQNHPLLRYYQSRVTISDEQAKYLRTFNYPTFSLFGVMQDRGSGFHDDYSAANPGSYSHNYFDGVGMQRSNYLIGVGVTWNLTSPLRVREQVASQRFNSRGLQDEYNLVSQRLQAQLLLSDAKIKNAVANYVEAPIELKTATDAFQQKTVLYKNGLSNIVDVTQALFLLNRAETDRDIAYNNVWQALLLKAAASGDITLFTNAF
ncbi:outer membrane efflux protein [Russula earlei]|uniref:Outer membrane efflux protein n=1 Tax=Russula earlei TaxID=71964 RepID=A0ACC0TXG2_9AGAM|nr:outer membrane efflux protein [Russula earlei]